MGMFLDTGAGGNLIFNMEKARIAGVMASDNSNVRNNTSVMVGVGDGGYRIQVNEAPIQYVDIGGVQFDSQGITTRLVECDIDLSNVANGVLGSKLFQNCRVVVDYQKKRLGVVPLSSTDKLRNRLV